MNPNQRSQTVMVALVAALLIPRIQKMTGVKLDIEDVAALVAAAPAAWHGFLTFLDRYFPPKNPTQAASAAKE